MTQVDTILNCRWLIPIEPHETVYENYAVAIKDGRIEALLPQKSMLQQYEANNHVDLMNHALLPGFINAHAHSPMVLFKGLADDLPLMDWLNNYIWPAEAKWLNPEFIAEGTEIAIAEMIKNGTTCFNEHYFFPDIIAQAAIDSSIRACVGGTIINFPTAWSKNEKDGLNKLMMIIENFPDHPLIRFALAPHAPYTTTDEILKEIKTLSEQYHLSVHMHVQETAVEVAESIAKLGKRPLRRLYDLGLLSPRFLSVHMTQINDEDIGLLKETNANVAHCPESNLKLVSGFCPVAKLLENKINVALGTDGAASNNNLDMIGEMRTAALIGKTVALSPTAVSAPEVLRMATYNGAKALGLHHEIGSIEKGKAADLIAIDLMHLNTQPLYNPISQIVYATSNTQITDVWVAGKQLLKNKELKTLDEDKVLATAAKWSARICANA